uniref:Uncharacterized protein n=1 Tax=Ditylenchus dipsaci TaxID=166011 RepID=A0A915E114_9BILA
MELVGTKFDEVALASNHYSTWINSGKDPFFLLQGSIPVKELLDAFLLEFLLPNSVAEESLCLLANADHGLQNELEFFLKAKAISAALIF